MPQWSGQLQIKDLLTNSDVLPSEAKEIGKEVANRLQGTAIHFHPSIRTAFLSVRNQNEFNQAMDLLYDAADDNRTWVY